GALIEQGISDLFVRALANPPHRFTRVEFGGEQVWPEPSQLCVALELRRLGPDLLAAEFDASEAVRRICERAHKEIGDALLDQSALAGIGNVYKSEVLFTCRVNPFARTGTLNEATIARLVETARKFLVANVSDGMGAAMTTYVGFRRTTRRDDPRERLWVYGRGRLPCRRCGTPIRVRKQGADARLTYWCETCQP
ncbi:MAG TPA: zinc finger domain-containing protein, partial [Vicinamibacterales bacterium]|nr:zinc finger domain-containing protein [Vicinamibacterales bacterium]